jgi:hypothetical protein
MKQLRLNTIFPSTDAEITIFSDFGGKNWRFSRKRKCVKTMKSVCLYKVNLMTASLLLIHHYMEQTPWMKV